jgi:hypothetical protein
MVPGPSADENRVTLFDTMMFLTELQTLRLKLKMHEADLVRFLGEAAPNLESIATTERVIRDYKAKIALFPPED